MAQIGSIYPFFSMDHAPAENYLVHSLFFSPWTILLLKTIWSTRPFSLHGPNFHRKQFGPPAFFLPMDHTPSDYYLVHLRFFSSWTIPPPITIWSTRSFSPHGPNFHRKLFGPPALFLSMDQTTSEKAVAFPL